MGSVWEDSFGDASTSFLIGLLLGAVMTVIFWVVRFRWSRRDDDVFDHTIKSLPEEAIEITRSIIEASDYPRDEKDSGIELVEMVSGEFPVLFGKSRKESLESFSRVRKGMLEKACFSEKDKRLVDSFSELARELISTKSDD